MNYAYPLHSCFDDTLLHLKGFPLSLFDAGFERVATLLPAENVGVVLFHFRLEALEFLAMQARSRNFLNAVRI